MSIVKKINNMALVQDEKVAGFVVFGRGVGFRPLRTSLRTPASFLRVQLL